MINPSNRTMPPGQRFSYVKYDPIRARKQEGFKLLFDRLDQMALEELPNCRYRSAFLTELERCYMWTGKALRDEQIEIDGKIKHVAERTSPEDEPSGMIVTYHCRECEKDTFVSISPEAKEFSHYHKCLFCGRNTAWATSAGVPRTNEEPLKPFVMPLSIPAPTLGNTSPFITEYRCPDCNVEFSMAYSAKEEIPTMVRCGGCGFKTARRIVKTGLQKG